MPAAHPAAPRELALTWDEVEHQRLRFGPNKVATASFVAPPVRRFLKILLGPLPSILLILAAISWFTGAVTGAVVITVMVFFSSILLFIQEYRSQKAAELLRQLVQITCTVVRRRNGVLAEAEIPIEELVPGDLVRLTAGDFIPAELRILESKDLYVDESRLTGESIPVEKSALLNKTPAQDINPPDICFMASHAVSGSALAVVFATGKQTRFGQTVAASATLGEPSHFEKSVQQFIWLMIRVMLVIVPIVLVVNGMIREDWLQAMLFATAVAVGLTPEMLPMMITVNLSRGAITMSRHKVIVKRLGAIQDLGAMTVLCADKTGTLTEDRIILMKAVNTASQENAQTLRYAYITSLHQTGLKNLLDDAILRHVRDHGLFSEAIEHQKIDELAFDFERRRMSVLIARPGESPLLVCKGAAEELLSVCDTILISDEKTPFSKTHRQAQHQKIRQMQEDGFRIVGIAIREVDKDVQILKPSDEAGLTLVGYVCFLDPPKQSAHLAVHELMQDGIEIKILTGDSPWITLRICKEVGLPVKGVLTGTEIDRLDDDELLTRSRQASVFAQLSPTQKSRVICALKKGDHVVGFLGDGINDGPALKAADVGISVDTATDIARESADIILLEKNLTVLHRGTLEGRRVFTNLMKYLKVSSGSSFGNVISLSGSSALLPFLPMAPTQLLLNNLLFDIAQTAIATDRVDRKALNKPQIWDIQKLRSMMIKVGLISSFFDYLTFSVLWFGFQLNTPAQSASFQTAWFIESLLSQTLVIHVIRGLWQPGKPNQPSLTLLLTTSAICAAGLSLPFTPLAPFFGFEPLSLAICLCMMLIVSAYLFLMHRLQTTI